MGGWVGVCVCVSVSVCVRVCLCLRLTREDAVKLIGLSLPLAAKNPHGDSYEFRLFGLRTALRALGPPGPRRPIRSSHSPFKV